ncbi:E3 ubiquitin-protein ligase RMND5A isoform X3 [Folsomia candida]|nr:E3 ubiquitin-protein ligase RMND5A isoform X3 [Folsomia candida]XP_021948329.1 E3 ubiquitin-protein ligase RMND5A isoform X3 [Folsomia candida]
MTDSCDAVERELDKVLQKFGCVSEHFNRTIDKQIEFIKALKQQFEEVSDEYELTPNQASILCDAVSQVRETVSRAATDHRDLHSSVSKVGKAIDRNFNPDFGAITRDGLFSGERAKILTQVVCQHLYRQGMLDIGDGLCKEAGLELDGTYKEPFVELHRILEALKQQDLTPALDWSADNRDALIAQGSSLEFKLHRLAFLNLVKKGRWYQSAAITYARQNFSQFVKRHEREVQTLMGCLLYVPAGMEGSPYAHLFDNGLWDDIQDTFTRDACARLGLSVDSPLAVCFSAGCTALPALLNICQVMQARQVSSIWNGKDELPIEIDLGKEFHYHSVFACPILRQQASESNPPMRLMCGHVISRDALHKLASGNKLKCPYCPGEQNPNEARLITF